MHFVINYVLVGKRLGVGRLIGPKTWDRIDTRFLEPRCSRSCFRRCLGVVCVICVLDVCLVCIGPGMAVDCGFTKRTVEL